MSREGTAVTGTKKQGFATTAKALSSIGLATVLLAGCGNSIEDELGMGKQSPDEFAIVAKAPLIIPPDFKLRPPQPGAPRPTEANTAEVAQYMIYGNESVAGSASPGEALLLKEAGAQTADPNIRATVDREGSDLVSKDDTFLEEILSNEGDVYVGENTIDPAAEKQRLEGGPAAVDAAASMNNSGDSGFMEREGVEEQEAIGEESGDDDDSFWTGWF